jgi:CoA:oxalate CoA-transferase
MSAADPGRPLDGLRVLDFTRVLAGPYCTALLADLGADVVKVEPPAGDDYRHIGPFLDDGSSALFETVNRGKRGLKLDLARAEDRDIACGLARRADVVVENFRPGVADKLGIGWEALAAINPRLVYASISGFGQDGPDAAKPAYDAIVQARSGLMSVTGEPDGDPTLIGESIADSVAGLFASWAILAALVERERTGRGRRIDLAMLDAMVAIQPLVLARYLATGVAPVRVGNRHALSAPFGVFHAADRPFVIAVLNPKLFASLSEAIGRPEIASDARFLTDAGRLAHEGALRDIIETWSRRLAASACVAQLEAAGVPAALIDDIEGVLTSPQGRRRSALQDVTDAKAPLGRVPEQPARFAGAARGRTHRAPRLDEHRAEILRRWTGEGP